MIEQEKCRQHGRVVRIETDRNGGLVVTCEACEWQRAKRCIDCGAPRRKPNARCQPCQRRKIRHYYRKRRARDCRRRGCKAAVEIGSKRQYCSDECFRLEKNRKYRERYRRRPAFRARRKAGNKAWRQTTAGRRSYIKSKRKGRLSGTQGYPTREAYLAAMAAQNVKRKESHRKWARDNQTVYGDHTAPTCSDCGEVVPWNGVGRPRKRCPVHHIG